MSSRRSTGSSGSGSSGKGAKRAGRISSSTKRLIESLERHQVNTLTELCRIEQTAASCTDEAEARAFQGPMTAAWVYYVSSSQLLTELRGLTRSYPISGDIVREAWARVTSDPESNRSWNLAWLCLMKMRDDGLVGVFAAAESTRQEMWGETVPSRDDVDQLAACFEYEWMTAIEIMLRHWTVAPTWY
ncbi:hypothetical protein LIA77_01775 [Sarocladium implicatum]|nr:hypothetical protein LIA77_01775 [Sarocladium implicatum]